MQSYNKGLRFRKPLLYFMGSSVSYSLRKSPIPDDTRNAGSLSLFAMSHPK